nr:sugar transferase [Arthrobacter sp. H14]
MVFASGWLVSSFGGTAISGSTASVPMSVFVCAIWAAMMFLFHTRDPQLMGIGAAEYKRVIHSCAATVGWLAAVALLLGGDAAGGYLLMIFPVGALVLVADRWTWRQWLNRQRRFGHYLSRVIVLGRDEDVRYVVRQIAKKSGAAYDVVGAVVEGDPGREAIQVDRQRIPLVSGLEDIPDAVTMAGADAVIVAGHLAHGSKYVRELGWKLEATATELVLASALTNVAGPRIRMRHVEGLPLMHVELPNFKGGRHVLKRAFDILVATLALIILAPLLCFLGLLVRHDSSGGAFFNQERVGRNGSTFGMYKFRSMVESAEDELALLANLNEGAGPLFKIRSDPRVTRIGAWLRRYSLDELPQFINVLKGDMSLVGPRPPLPSEVADYQGHVHRRLFIKPGITGLWQINGRSDLDWDESVRLDLYYVENWSLAGDLMIMWRTVKVMLRPTGAY